MQTDEQAIRGIIDLWMRASQAGDSATISTLMSEDVVFLAPGHPPMHGRTQFLAGFAQMIEQVTMTGSSEVQELEISGNLAYCWTRLSVKVTPRNGGSERQRSGYTLSVFKKFEDGVWRLIRDANMLAAE